MLTAPPAMTHRTLLATGLLLGGLACGADAALAGSSTYTSVVSEVDACNQAQYLMPNQAVVQGYRVRTRTTSNGSSFECRVQWTQKAKAEITGAPILFPSKVHQPIFAAGWL